MEEKEKKNPWIISLVGILMQVASFALTMWLVWKGAEKEDAIKELVFDRTAMKLIPAQSYADQCMTLFWIGFAGGILCIAYSILRDEEWKKKIPAILFSIVFVFLILEADAFFASAIYVDEGMGQMPELEIVSSGEHEFLYVRKHLIHNVQVFFLHEDKAFRVDGFEGDGMERTYAAQKDETALLEAYYINITENGEIIWRELVYVQHWWDSGDGSF